MNFTPEQLAKAKAAKSVEELLALAKENGMEMTDDEAKKYFADLHREGELADEELDNVAGGCGDSRPESVPITTTGGGEICPYCNGTLFRTKENLDPNGDNYDIHACDTCGATFRRYHKGDEWTTN